MPIGRETKFHSRVYPVFQVSMNPWLILCAKPAAFDKGVPSAETAN